MARTPLPSSGRRRYPWRESRRSAHPPRREPRMNDESIAYSVDKRWSRRSFDRASATYDTAAVLQTEVRNVLLQRLDLTDLSPVVVVDAGAGTGHAAHALKRRYPNAHVL